MKPRALRLALCLAVLGASVPLRESVAAPKVDLEAYLGDVPMANDNRTYVSVLDEITDSVTGVSPGAKRSSILYSSTNAAGDFVNTELDVVVHGKMLLVGTRTLGDLTFFTPKPKKAVAFHLKQGKAYKFSIPSKVFLNGQKVAKAKEYGNVTFLGFEDVTTPLGTFQNAAHFERTDNLLVKAGKQKIESKLAIESWVVAGLGSVRYIESEDFLENGIVTDSTPPTEWLLDHGVVQGQPVPAEVASVPMPWQVGGAGASASSGASIRVEFSLSASDAVQTTGYFVVEQPAAGIDLMNADASVITQEAAGLAAQAPGTLVRTGTTATGQVIYLQGVDYSQPPPGP